MNETFKDTRASILTYRFTSQEANQLILYHQYVRNIRGMTSVHPKLRSKQHAPGVNNLARKTRSNKHTLRGIRLSTANILAQLTHSTNSTLRDRNFEKRESG